MASLIETLIDVLDKENTEYQGLLKLSEEKTTAIVNGNVERLQEILGLEQRSIDKINKLDAFRDENVGDICNVLNIPRKGIKIENIARYVVRTAQRCKSSYGCSYETEKNT